MYNSIHTKQIYDVGNKVIALGYGNIILSSADIVCISHFANSGFALNSAIYHIEQALNNVGDSLHNYLNNSLVDKYFQLMDLRGSHLGFKYLLIISLGNIIDHKKVDKNNAGIIIRSNVERGTQNSIDTLVKTDCESIDVTAMGTQYGYTNREQSFNILMNWGMKMIKDIPKMNTIRFVSYDIDTFIDFYDSLAKLRELKKVEQSFISNVDTKLLNEFSGSVNTAVYGLDNNPRSSITSCRNIIEDIARRLSQDPHMNLFDTISSLRNRIPPNIYSYFNTCRILGNFGNHDFAKFIPTRRDAEGILILTVRIVEWYLGENAIKKAI